MIVLALALVATFTIAAPTVSTRRVGGMRFIKVGRLCCSYCVTRESRPFADGVVL